MQPEIIDQVAELFAQIVANPDAASPLLLKFEHLGDNELFDWFKAIKDTLVPRVADW
jgi:hypothetical protein